MMKARNFSLILGVALVLFVGSFASAAFVKSRPGDGQMSVGATGDVLYSQLDDPSGSAFTDQAFEAYYAAYDSEGAGDFTVTDAAGWDIDTINTPGTQTVAGTNPFFVNHFFYSDNPAGGNTGLPGAVVCAFPANTNFQSAGDGDISTTVDCNLPAGVHWVSQQVRQDFNPFGQHFWATRLNAAPPSEGVFRNPGNGFGSGCLDWQPANTVCGMIGKDFLFELLGKPRQVTTPTPGVPAIGPLGIAFMVLALGGGSAYVLGRRRA
jgi:hypothetical protein